MVAEWGSMQHGYAALDAHRDMSNTTEAYHWQTASCHCHVGHTSTHVSMTNCSFHWHACYMPLNTFPLPPASHLLSEGTLPPPAPFGDKKQKNVSSLCDVLLWHMTLLVQCLDQAQHNTLVWWVFSPWDPCSCWRHTLLQAMPFPVVEIDKLGAEIRRESNFQANIRKAREGRPCTENMEGGHEIGASTGGNTDHVRFG